MVTYNFQTNKNNTSIIIITMDNNLIGEFENSKNNIYTLPNDCVGLLITYNWDIENKKFILYAPQIKDPHYVTKVKAIEEEIQNFIKTADNNPIYFAMPYETDYGILLTHKPEPFTGKLIGGGFEGHGTVAMIKDCPKNLLILGQND